MPVSIKSYDILGEILQVNQISWKYGKIILKKQNLNRFQRLFTMHVNSPITANNLSKELFIFSNLFKLFTCYIPMPCVFTAILLLLLFCRLQI